MSVFTRLNRAVKAYRSNVDWKQLEQDIETLSRESGADAPVLEKSSSSRLEIRNNDRDVAFVSAFSILRNVFRQSEKIPEYGNPERDFHLDALWKQEPILAGAVYSMVAKMTALKWSVTGRRNTALQAAKLFSRAAFIGGYDWGGFISSSANDFYTINRGVFWETPRDGDAQTGKLADIGHIDALACELTGNTKFPMIYSSEVTGQQLRFKEGEYIHFSSLPSPREINLGYGFCAVDRAFRAMKLLMGLHDYDDEKLNNLPPEGVAAVTGLTIDEFYDALRLWKAGRERDKSLTFPQVLWLIGSQPNSQVQVNFTGFSQIPESFDRQTVVTQYISTLSLDFGVDAREFWPISSGSLGTASESEIQHLKAKGKGPGEFISTIERHLNGELPDGVDFAFDTQDIEEDANAAAVAKAWIDAFLPLTTAGGAAEEVMKKDEFLRLLADKGVIPDYLVNDDRIVVEDSDIHNKEFKSDGHSLDYTTFYWEKGILKEKRIPPIIIYSGGNNVQVPIADVPGMSSDNGNGHVNIDSVADALALLKQAESDAFEPRRNIRGNPIPEDETVRGYRITRNTVRDELQRWREHPVLSEYALSADEEESIPEK